MRLNQNRKTHMLPHTNLCTLTMSLVWFIYSHSGSGGFKVTHLDQRHNQRESGNSMMKIQNNKSNGCRGRATEVSEAWQSSAVIQALQVISKTELENRSLFPQGNTLQLSCGWSFCAKNLISLTLSLKPVWRYVPRSPLLYPVCS